MKIDLHGHRAVISGSTAGIGFAIAKGLAEAGAAVLLNGRTERSTMGAVKRITEALPAASVDGLAADLGTAEGVTEFLRNAGSADILVNNLGIFEPKPFEQIPDADWYRFFETNVMSGIRLSRHFLPAMREKNWGRVVFISSESALNVPTEMIHYGMTKTAQLAVSRGLAQQMAGTGVTVNAVLPGPTRTEGVLDFLAAMSKDSSQSAEAIELEFLLQNRPSSIIRRLATPEEVANMVVYVCSEQASATTGAALRVDGGVVQYIV
jgi:NAD(P)-dependent dehydrogenase (short-subunit alcohol dehydrogenase family)